MRLGKFVEQVLPLGSGVNVRVRPISTAVIALARDMARERLTALRASPPEGLSFDNPAHVRALSQELFEVSLGVAAIVGWEGVEDAASPVPAPVTPENVELLMRMWPIGDEFMKKYFFKSAAQLVVAEGNVSRPAPSGTLAGAAASVPDVEQQTSPAPAASQV
jgi:hypothetical protein